MGGAWVVLQCTTHGQEGSHAERKNIYAQLREIIITERAVILLNYVPFQNKAEFPPLGANSVL